MTIAGQIIHAGVEPAFSPWKGDVLTTWPMDVTRKHVSRACIDHLSAPTQSAFLLCYTLNATQLTQNKAGISCLFCTGAPRVISQSLWRYPPLNSYSSWCRRQPYAPVRTWTPQLPHSMWGALPLSHDALECIWTKSALPFYSGSSQREP